MTSNFKVFGGGRDEWCRRLFSPWRFRRVENGEELQNGQHMRRFHRVLLISILNNTPYAKYRITNNN